METIWKPYENHTKPMGFVCFCLASGKILPSVLVVHGPTHARLENIDDSGCWRKTEKYYVGNKLVVHEAGKSARGVMAGWLSLRKECPELFADGLRIWQQPCAVVDSIIWRWQQELDAEQYDQAVRITDCLGAVWTDRSKESAYLLSQVDAPVPPGCTPLCQPTDTHLANRTRQSIHHRCSLSL